MPSFKQGDIVWVRINDEAGRNPKCRPAVIVTPTEEVLPGEPIVVAAATTTLNDPISAEHVELPWQNGRHPVTGLYKRCAVVCNWLVEINQDAIQNKGGVVPESQLRQILAKIPRT